VPILGHHRPRAADPISLADLDALAHERMEPAARRQLKGSRSEAITGGSLEAFRQAGDRLRDRLRLFILAGAARTSPRRSRPRSAEPAVLRAVT